MVKWIIKPHYIWEALRVTLTANGSVRSPARVLVDGEVDHKTPLHLGGAESDANRQWICKEPCHRLKTESEEKERDNKY